MHKGSYTQLVWIWTYGTLHARNFGPLTQEALEGRETRAETVVSEAEAAVLHMK